MLINDIVNSKKVIEKALDGTWMRQQVTAQNIANVDTPRYKAKAVSFEEHLQRIVKKDDFKKEDADQVKIKVNTKNRNLSMRIDGNNVDIDVEMANLAKSQLMYQSLLRVASFSSIKTVLSGQ